MSILDERYERLLPSIELLSDEAVLAQAWKKTDTYIRYRNSYADILELEETAICLPDKLTEWSKQIESDNHSEKRLAKYVPCPKNYEWLFEDNLNRKNAWHPAKTKDKLEKSKQELRPLAHLSVRDQVMASSVMLCLADAIESLQGNTDPESYANNREARSQVVSYGNRLFCDWTSNAVSEKQHARFRWGNAGAYSQYYTDYQRFLERPVQVCVEAYQDSDSLYIVSLDFEKFFDSIHQQDLIEKLQKAYKDYCHIFNKPEHQDERFWEAVKKILCWEWDRESLYLPEDQLLGIPQGLVSGGFFANAYMAEFDTKLKSLVGHSAFIEPGKMASFQVVDYCRYVDDIRLVIKIDDLFCGCTKTLSEAITEWFKTNINIVFAGAIRKPSIKDDKTQIIAYRDFTLNGATSALMRNVQSRISNAPDQEVLEQAAAALDHLLVISESKPVKAKEQNPLKLAHIVRPQGDVRDDTIKRFLAYRYRKVLRQRRLMADSEIPITNPSNGQTFTELDLVDHEIETVARKLISVWSRNPSLVTVLRCALDLCPSADLLFPVLEALESKFSSKLEDEKLTVYYIASELFKAATIETGLSSQLEYPSKADISAYRMELKKFALRLMDRASELPWYLKSQVLLFMAVMKAPVDKMNVRGVENYIKLHGAMAFREKLTNKDAICSLILTLIATRQSQNWSQFHLWFGAGLTKLKNPALREKLLEIFLSAQPDQISSLINTWQTNRPKNSSSWLDIISLYHHEPAEDFLASPITSWPKAGLKLIDVVMHPANPFTHENALTKLAQELIENDEFLGNEGVELSDFKIVEANWQNIQDPREKVFTIALDKSWRKGFTKPLNSSPPWVITDKQWVYRLGRLLRAAAIGEMDFTSRSFIVREHQIGRYEGLNTNWFKRRMGLMPVNSGLGKESIPISPWLTQTIMSLLQWPGLHIDDEMKAGE